MASGESSGPIHPDATRNGKRYLFSAKHHGHDPNASRWLPALSRDEEFSVFDTADFHIVRDERGWLYGVRIGSSGDVLELGTWGQQVAEFPLARPSEPWHGYPLWPLKEVGSSNRRGEKHRPPKGVFVRMEAEGLIRTRDRKRLQKGDHA